MTKWDLPIWSTTKIQAFLPAHFQQEEWQKNNNKYINYSKLPQKRTNRLVSSRTLSRLVRNNTIRIVCYLFHLLLCARNVMFFCGLKRTVDLIALERLGRFDRLREHRFDNEYLLGLIKIKMDKLTFGFWSARSHHKEET